MKKLTEKWETIMTMKSWYVEKINEIDKPVAKMKKKKKREKTQNQHQKGNWWYHLHCRYQRDKKATQRTILCTKILQIGWNEAIPQRIHITTTLPLLNK